MEGFERFLKFGNIDDPDEFDFGDGSDAGNNQSNENTQTVDSFNNDEPASHISADLDFMYNIGGTSDNSFNPDDGMIFPDIKPKKRNDSKPCIVIIDDDFSTLDLMKIYLQRDFIVKDFSNPKDAIFYLNTNLPDLIFIDCFLTTIATKQVISIIRSYSELKNVPIYYTADESEESAVINKLTDDISGIITRPIARGKLQAILDAVFAKDETEDGNK